MKPIYIMAPTQTNHLEPIKCKAPRTKRAKRKDVPKEYRKDKLTVFKNWLFYVRQDIKRTFRKGC